MAFQGVSFNPLSFEQSNPMLAGMQAGAQIMGQTNQNIASSISNQLQSANLPYAGQLAQAGLAQAQQMPAYTASQTALNIGTLPYLGMKYYAPLLGAQARMAQANIMNANSVRGWSNTPGGENLIANNPNLSQGIANTIAGQINQSNNVLGITAPAPSNVNYSQIPNTQGNSANAPINQPQNLPMSPQQIKQLQDNLAAAQNGSNVQQGVANAYAKSSSTGPQTNQRLYASELDGLFAGASQYMPAVTNYAGIKGQAELLKDRTMSGFGSTNQNYSDYTFFTRNYAPSIANEMRRTLGGQATDTEKKTMDEIADPTYWDTNPSLAMSQFNNLKDMYAKYVNPPLSQSVSQIKQGLANSAQTPAASGAASTGGLVKVQTADGKHWSIPAAQLQAALSRPGVKQVQ